MWSLQVQLQKPHRSCCPAAGWTSPPGWPRRPTGTPLSPLSRGLPAAWDRCGESRQLSQGPPGVFLPLTEVTLNQEDATKHWLGHSLSLGREVFY